MQIANKPRHFWLSYSKLTEIYIYMGSATPNGQTSSGNCSKCPLRGFSLHVFCIKIKHIRLRYFQSSWQTKHKNNADG